MPDWLTETAGASPIPAATMALRLLVALALGAAVAGVYRLSHGREAREARTLSATLVLLTVLLAMVSMVIGESVARAFGLVGALSIVRFRTVVDDTRDTAFVIFAVIVGMAAGTGLVLVPLLGIPVVAAAAVVLSNARVGGRGGVGGAGGGGARPRHVLTVRLASDRDPAAVLAPVLARRTRGHRLSSVAAVRQGTAIETTYAVALASADDAAALVVELNTVQGIQGIELREA